MSNEEHYLKKELYELIKKDDVVFEFLQVGSLDGVWYWDLEHYEDEWMSPRFWELLGYDPDEKKHLASEWQDLIYPEDLELATENFIRHCEDPSHAYDQVVRYYHKDGSTIWVRCRGVAIRDDSGKPVRMLGAHTDITSLKKAEEQLLSKTIQLEAANQKLEEAVLKIKELSSILPICCVCKNIRDDKGYWHRVESYISEHTGSNFSHGYCPECAEKVREEMGLAPKQNTT